MTMREGFVLFSKCTRTRPPKSVVLLVDPLRERVGVGVLGARADAREQQCGPGMSAARTNAQHRHEHQQQQQQHSGWAVTMHNERWPLGVGNWNTLGTTHTKHEFSAAPTDSPALQGLTIEIAPLGITHTPPSRFVEK